MKDFEYGFQDEKEMTITLTLEDDSELVCGVVAIFPAKEKDYIAVTPLVEDSEDLFLYRLRGFNGDIEDIDLENIESDEEFGEAAEAYEELVEALADEE